MRVIKILQEENAIPSGKRLGKLTKPENCGPTNDFGGEASDSGTFPPRAEWPPIFEQVVLRDPGHGRTPVISMYGHSKTSPGPANTTRRTFIPDNTAELCFWNILCGRGGRSIIRGGLSCGLSRPRPGRIGVGENRKLESGKTFGFVGDGSESSLGYGKFRERSPLKTREREY